MLIVNINISNVDFRISDPVTKDLEVSLFTTILQETICDSYTPLKIILSSVSWLVFRLNIPIDLNSQI